MRPFVYYRLPCLGKYLFSGNVEVSNSTYGRRGKRFSIFELAKFLFKNESGYYIEKLYSNNPEVFL